jgi:hypothetical protein
MKITFRSVFSRLKIRIAAGMPVPKKQVARQSDHGIQKVLADQLRADRAFARAAKQHAMRYDHADAPVNVGAAFDHVRDKGEITFAFGWNAALEAFETVVAHVFCAPFVQGKRWVGDDDLKFHQQVVFSVFGFSDRVAHSIRASSMPCRNMFIFAKAQVLPWTS